MKSEEIKKIEIDFYDKSASALNFFRPWNKCIASYLQLPYETFFKFVKTNSHKDMQILDLCCGTGDFSWDIARITNGNVLGVDISPKSIEVCKKQLKRDYIENLSFEVGDVEKLKFPESSLDMVCMLGSLSCIDVDVVLKNVKKWLKPNGTFIVVDTYGYNPFFNLKRKLNCLLKKRTVNTVNNIVKKTTIETIKSCFEKTEVSYYGTFAFIGPFLKYIIGGTMTKKVVDSLDKCFPFLKKYAFKFVLCAKFPKKDQNKFTSDD